MFAYPPNSKAILRRSVAGVGLMVVLIVAAGCRTTVRRLPSPHRQFAVTEQLNHVQTPATVGSDSEFQSPGIADSLPSEPPLEEDEVIASLREAGGKLRPNDSGAIVEIDLSFSDVTDSQLQAVTVFPELAELDLTGTDIHDDGLSALLQLKSLRAVKLKGTKITSAGLRLLAPIQTLVLLDASNTAIADDGLSEAAQWTNLRYLSLNNTSVSDDGLRNLESLRDLKGLSVINTAVTESGVHNLKKSLPECLIVAQTGREVTQAEPQNSMPTLRDPESLISSYAGIGSQTQLAQLVELAGLQPHLAVHLSKVYSSREQWPETVQILATASVADIDNPAIHYALGEALARSGRPDDAIRHLEQAVGSAEAKYLVGMIVYENSLRTCERYFGDVVEADPTLNAAQVRRERIQQELASLTLRRKPQTASRFNDDALQIVPAQPMRTVSHAKNSQWLAPLEPNEK